MSVRIRKFVVVVEETLEESGREIAPPTRRAAALAVIENPFADRYEEDLEVLMQAGEELGRTLGEKAVAALGVAPSRIESYGKAAIVGEGGELEHAAAILHPRMGKPLRQAVEKGAALVPSSKKMGGMGAAIDVPLGHKDEPWSFDHFDTLTICIGDSPRPQEIMVVMAVADGGRVNPRCGSGPITS